MIASQRLGDVVKITNGFAFKSSLYVDEGIRIVRITNVQKGKIVDDTPKFYPSSAYDEFSNFQINADDILMSLTGNVGRVGLFPKEMLPALVNQRVCRIKSTSKQLDGKYLFYFLNSNEFEHNAIVNSSGIAQLNLSTRWVANYQILLPPLAEQKKIAAILDAADVLRQKDQQLIDKYNALSQSLFLDMFGDPVTNPMGWALARIDSLCSIVRGSSPRPKGDPRFYGGSIPRLMVADLTRDGKRVIPRIDSLTEEGAKRSRPIQSGTVVMAVSGNVGLSSILEVDACIHDGFIAFKELDASKIHPNFLVDLMMYLKSTHASRQAGAIFKNLTTTQIKEMQIPLPPLHLQHDFCEKIEAIESQAKLATACLQKSEDLFNSLLQRAFKGELVV